MGEGSAMSNPQPNCQRVSLHPLMYLILPVCFMDGNDLTERVNNQCDVETASGARPRVGTS